MTIEEIITNIEKTMANATKGSWVIFDNEHAQYDPSRFENGAYVLISPSDCEHHPIADFSCNHSCRDDSECLANAEYVEAVQPEHIAALIAAYRKAIQ